MNYKFCFLFCTFITTLLFSTVSHGRPVVAFGYLSNESGQVDYNYIETVFPSSFASSLQAIQDVQVLKPARVNAILYKYGETLKKDYSPAELPELAEKIQSNVFVYGKFMPLEGNRIKIILHLFVRDSRELFTFTDIGRMETRIFRIVDRVSIKMVNFLGENSRYRADPIPPGSRIGLFSNLKGPEVNRLYMAFMKKNYHVLSVQSADLHNIVDDMIIDKFRYIRTENSSYRDIEDIRIDPLLTGTWAGKGHAAALDSVKRMYNVYNRDYEQKVTDAMKRMSKAFNNGIDYLMFIGFSGSRNAAWVRCIDVRSRDLVWMETRVITDEDEPVSGIVQGLIHRMTAEIRNPFDSRKEVLKK
ncbi:MAG TPA: hypothetical protein PK544_01820 [Spirochaetota bacterium]|nr:hypothetical protein [Spirochaetota bacterium]